MTQKTAEMLQTVQQTLTTAQKYEHACHVLNFDLETICPPKAMEQQGDLIAYLSNEGFKLKKDPAFIEAGEYLYAHRDELEEADAVLARQLHREYLHTKNITPEKMHSFSTVMNRAYVRWIEAKQASDFSLFAPSLREVLAVNREEVSLREPEDPSAPAASVYDQLLDDYERGITTEDLDALFGACKERLLPLMKQILASPKKIRTDFLSRKVTDEAQERMARYLLDVLQYDLQRGAFTTTEHPFTDWMAPNDVRITTHYHEDAFASSMYSIIHETGHALFEMLQPKEDWEHFIDSGKTMAMHESVSRFYENRIGRSEAFVHRIYPGVCEIFPEVMRDVSERELYEALNVVQPSLIRTEADEFTYTFHIIIRYEIEKALVSGEASIDDVPRLWNEKYREYLGIEPENDRTGCLQDVHWSSGFGYFPTYAVGNMYNAMYYNRLKNELDLDQVVSSGDFAALNGWMAENIFRRANRLAPHEWIREITGRELTADDFLDYLETKYRDLYEI